MYKTVRHGENSLQYTILPQQEDSNASVAISAGGRSSAGVRRRARRGRTATILILTLILACGVVGAAVVVPLLVSTDLGALPSAFQRFSGTAHHHGGHHAHHVVPRNRTWHHNATTTTSTTTPAPSTTEEPSTAAPSTSAPTTARATEAPSTLTSTEEAPTTLQDVSGLLEEGTAAKDHDHGGPSKKKALPDDPRNGTTHIVVSATVGRDNRSSEEPTVTPELLPRTTEHPPAHRSWLEPRWPFADPSSYFQWTGYNGRDSLLLPVILGGALLVLLLAICICYSLRRRRQKALRRQTIGKISSDLQCGDKATLLPDGSEEE